MERFQVNTLVDRVTAVDERYARVIYGVVGRRNLDATHDSRIAMVFRHAEYLGECSGRDFDVVVEQAKPSASSDRRSGIGGDGESLIVRLMDDAVISGEGIQIFTAIVFAAIVDPNHLVEDRVRHMCFQCVATRLRVGELIKNGNDE